MYIYINNPSPISNPSNFFEIQYKQKHNRQTSVIIKISSSTEATRFVTRVGSVETTGLVTSEMTGLWRLETSGLGSTRLESAEVTGHESPETTRCGTTRFGNSKTTTLGSTEATTLGNAKATGLLDLSSPD